MLDKYRSPMYNHRVINKATLINQTKNKGGDTVSEEKKQEILCVIHEALSEIPEEYQADVGKSITHDIGVMAKTIGIINANQPG